MYNIFTFFDTSHFRNFKTINSTKQYLNVYKKFDYMVNCDLSEYESISIDKLIECIEEQL